MDESVVTVDPEFIVIPENHTGTSDSILMSPVNIQLNDCAQELRNQNLFVQPPMKFEKDSLRIERTRTLLVSIIVRDRRVRIVRSQ